MLIFIEGGKSKNLKNKFSSKITPYTKPFNASKVLKIVEDVEVRNKQIVFDNYYSSKPQRQTDDPFEKQGTPSTNNI